MRKALRKLIPQGFRFSLRRLYLRSIAERHRNAGNVSSDPGETLLIPASPWAGNLGDTAMLQGLVSELNRKGRTHLQLAPYGDHEHWSSAVGLPIFGVAPRRLSDYVAWLPRLKEISEVYLNGADVLDGKYSLALSLARLEFVDFLAASGISAVITGCSVREDAPGAVVSAFRGLHENVRVCARDPESQRRLRRWTSKEIPLVADLAFLLDPKLDENVLLEAVTRLKSSGPGASVVAIAPNPIAVKLGKSTPAERGVRMVEFCTTLIESLAAQYPSAGFLLIPHDFRSEWSDARICGDVVERLSSALKERVVVSQSHEPREIKAALALADALVTGRMHCGIAALGVGTPAVFLDYQGKVAGLLNIFGLDSRVEFTESPEAVAEKAEKFVHGILREGVGLREKVMGALPSIQELSSGNVLGNGRSSESRIPGADD